MFFLSFNDRRRNEFLIVFFVTSDVRRNVRWSRAAHIRLIAFSSVMSWFRTAITNSLTRTAWKWKWKKTFFPVLTRTKFFFTSIRWSKIVRRAWSRFSTITAQMSWRKTRFLLSSFHVCRFSSRYLFHCNCSKRFRYCLMDNREQNDQFDCNDSWKQKKKKETNRPFVLLDFRSFEPSSPWTFVWWTTTTTTRASTIRAVRWSTTTERAWKTYEEQAYFSFFFPFEENRRIVSTSSRTSTAWNRRKSIKYFQNLKSTSFLPCPSPSGHSRAKWPGWERKFNKLYEIIFIESYLITLVT